MKVGEIIGLLVSPASPGNRVFFAIDTLGLFRQKPDGSYSNGQLFTRQPVALNAIGHTAAGQDVLPDIGQSGAAPPARPPPVTTVVGPTPPLNLVTVFREKAATSEPRDNALKNALDDGLECVGIGGWDGVEVRSLRRIIPGEDAIDERGMNVTVQVQSAAEAVLNEIAPPRQRVTP